MKVGSLFAGVGGFDIAAERAGMEVVWQSEVDAAASRVLEHHWPGLNRGDIHGITDTAGVDVLCGGFPCQDYSVAGNRSGLAGDRGALWWEYHRLIREGRPTWVVAENVPGLLSSRGGADFGTIIDSLVELGYGVVWGVLDAQYFGVAQRRRRVFIIGHAGGEPRPEILALSEGLFGHPAPSRETGKGTAGGVAGSPVVGIPDPAYGLTARNAQDRPESGAATLVVGSHGSGDITGSLTTAFTKQRLGEYVDIDVASTVAQRDYKDATDLVAIQNTTIGRSEHAYVTQPQVRRLTPLECERLQGFPDGWTNIPGNADTQRYRQMGNAVAVPVVEWIMRRISGTEE